MPTPADAALPTFADRRLRRRRTCVAFREIRGLVERAVRVALAASASLVRAEAGPPPSRAGQGARPQRGGTRWA
jgi:hypothetical protein